MIHDLAVLLIGYSVVGLVILLTAYLFFFTSVQKSRPGQAACLVLCLALGGLQLAHLQHLSTGLELFQARSYLALLFVVPGAFYFFSRDVLMPDARLPALSALHLLPPIVGPWLPSPFVVPAAFAIGAGYSLWLARVVYGLRRHVKRFRFEMFFFGLFAALAIGVFAIVVATPWIGFSGFYLAYACAIGLGVALVTAALLIFPDILTDVTEVAKLAYANSTLKGIDIDARLATLQGLMARDKLYRNENLTLALLAEAVGLTAHQLSELINTRFGVGFSRYVRELRVADARRILTDDQRSSVLSIGMMCGFGSQSAFYAAFREVTGQSPAAFRKQQSSSGSE